ncbi:MAG: hypothetical protein AB7H97_08375 [Pseudobdellovibrionaceae bacterium]
MKLITLTASILFATAASAHIEPGVFKGKTETGAECEMTAVKTYFEGQLRHPLTERVELVVDSTTYIVQHPAIIDETQSMASFDHDQFKGVVPNDKGANALVVKMSHEGGKEGPTEYYLIKHIYKGDNREMLKCSSLTHQD